MKTKPINKSQPNTTSEGMTPQQHIINALEFLRDEALQNNDAALTVIITNALVEAKYLEKAEEDGHKVILSVADQENIHRFLAQFLKMEPDKKKDFLNIIEVMSDDITNLTLIDNTSTQLN